MKIAAVIAEYNPFHTGHRYHIEQTRRLSGADYVVAIMGGNFTQRGEAAILEKRQRAAAALRSGVDAVVELPGLFTVRPAEVFAAAGVALAEAVGADVLSFGCETADLEFLHAALDAEAAAQQQIRAALSEGQSYARARGAAVAAALGVPAEAVNRPNLALALEYLRALRARNSSVQPLAVARQGDYHSDRMDAAYPSASALRQAARQGADVRRFMPGLDVDAAFMQPMEALDSVFLYVLRGYTPDRLREVCDMTEGLEHRVCKLSTNCTGRMQLLDELKCKRYTFSHLSRVLTQAVTGVTKALADAHPAPEYVRLLGIRSDARPLLREIARRATLPMVSDGAQLRGNAIFECECRMTDLFMLSSPNPAQRRAGLEYTARFLNA